MAKLSSLKIRMGQMHYEKQRKELDLQAMKVCFSSASWSCCLRVVVVPLTPCPAFSSVQTTLVQCLHFFTFLFYWLKLKQSL